MNQRNINLSTAKVSTPHLEDSAFERYDFGIGVTVEGTDGWERSSASKEITRAVYVRYDDDAPNAPTHKLNFTVIVKDGVFDDAWASDNKGQQIGHMPRAPRAGSKPS